MNRKTIFIGAIVSIFAIGSMSIANPNHKMRHGDYSNQERQAPNAKKIMRHLSKLGLSEEQIVEIETLVKNGIDSTKVQRETLKSMHHQMKALMHADAIDETAIKSLTYEMANIKGDLTIARLNKRNQIALFLNDEQKDKMQKMKQHRMMKRSK